MAASGATREPVAAQTLGDGTRGAPQPGGAGPAELLARLGPDPAAIRARAAGENFPVALRVLPAAPRRALLALYDVARLLDELGDAAAGDRLALLDAAEGELHAAFAGRAHHPVMRALTPVARRHDLPLAPFLRLVEANRCDQRHTGMASWDELEDYCALSANPVGELVLRVFGEATPQAIARSDRVCTALQVLEHCQDVVEDAAAGRVYLPQSDLRRFACAVEDLERAPASPALRRVVAEQVARSRALLAAAPPLVASLRGWARTVVAAFAAGGLATCRALERSGFDPHAATLRPRRRDLLRELVGTLVRARAA